ncbi:spermatogenesis-associated protein 33 [Carlito syrichta]|uniref:Spermatogenesis-associated protein 33 n=1 Tax=Carlito syrichta TaxID=1868482 RepID=A0A3Q0DQE5_CARSF|nr:spermatogenesis-associated protein 33 [Carlito syrichta]
MGLSRSKSKPKTGEEQRKGPAPSAARSKDKLVEKQPQEVRQPGWEAEMSADGTRRPPSALSADRHTYFSTYLYSRPHVFSLLENPDAKQKSNKKKCVIPRIIITRASNETLNSRTSVGSEEQKTIQEQDDWGLYHRHRHPSTVDAYKLDSKN